MKLLYLRINDDYVTDIPEKIINKDFNFSNDFKFEFNDNILSISFLSNFNNFYNVYSDNISYITEIIGRNGSGKTSLLSLIPLYLLSFSVNKKISFIYSILSDDNEIIVFENGIDFIINNFTRFKIRKEIFEYGNCNLYLKNTYLLFLSNCFSWDYNFYKSDVKSHFINISFDEFIRCENTNIRSFSNVYYDSYFYDKRFSGSYISSKKNFQRLNTINYILNKKKDFKSIGLTLDFSILNSFEDNEMIRFYDDNCEKCDFEKMVYDCILNYLNSSKYSDIEKVKISFLLRIIDMFFYELENKIKNLPFLKEHLYEKISKYCKKNVIDGNYMSIYSSFLNFLNFISNYKLIAKFDCKIKSLYSNVYFSENEKVHFVTLTKKIIKDDFILMSNSYTNLLEKFNILIEHSSFCIKNKGSIVYNDDFLNIVPYIFIESKDFKFLLDFIKFYLDNFNSNIFRIGCKSMSAGENAKIDLFSNIEIELKKIMRKTKSNNVDVIIMLDEPDLYFHPEWKRKFISEYLLFLSKYKNMNFQTIISSNEPFISSDLHSNSIISLDKKRNDIKPFASSLYCLLNDNYYLESFIGEFAIDKINNIIKNLKNGNCNLDDINEIGDTILKNELLKMIGDHNG